MQKKRNSKLVRIACDIDIELHESFKERVAEKGGFVSQYLRRLIIDDLEAKNRTPSDAMIAIIIGQMFIAMLCLFFGFISVFFG